MKSAFLPLMFLSVGWPALGQLSPPNAAGITFGQIHLIVKDVGTERRFFIDMMGGTPVENGKISMIQLPGVYIIITQGDADVSPVGPMLNHFGVALKDVAANRAKWEANHVTIDRAENPTSGYVHTPSGLRIEFFEDTSLTVPVTMHHLHFFTTPEKIPEIQAWYVNVFGGERSERYCTSCLPAHRRLMPTENLPGTNISFNTAPRPNSDSAPVSNKGHQIDHVGFEVKNLKAFIAGAEAKGIKFDEPYHASQNSKKVHVAFLTDPWGTRIELTEGLAP